MCFPRQPKVLFVFAYVRNRVIILVKKNSKYFLDLKHYLSTPLRSVSPVFHTCIRLLHESRDRTYYFAMTVCIFDQAHKPRGLLLFTQ